MSMAQLQSEREAQVREVEADFRDKAIRAGVAAPEYLRPVGDDEGYGYDGDPADLALVAARSDEGGEPGATPAPGEQTSGYLELEVDGESREVGLRLKDGTVHTIVIPPMTMERVAELGWHQNQVGKRHQELINCSDPARVRKHFAPRVTEAQRAQILYMIPDFPRELFGRMQAGSFMRLMRLFDEMSREAREAGSDPNP